MKCFIDALDADVDEGDIDDSNSDAPNDIDKENLRAKEIFHFNISSDVLTSYP